MSLLSLCSLQYNRILICILYYTNLWILHFITIFSCSMTASFVLLISAGWWVFFSLLFFMVCSFHFRCGRTRCRKHWRRRKRVMLLLSIKILELPLNAIPRLELVYSSSLNVKGFTHQYVLATSGLSYWGSQKCLCIVFLITLHLFCCFFILIIILHCKSVSRIVILSLVSEKW